MTAIFFRQCGALIWKNWIVLSKHPFLNLLRCFILPVAYGIFLAIAQSFLNKPNNYGIGVPAAISSLSDQFDGSLALVWADGANGIGSPSAQEIMAHITQNFTSSQLSAVKRVATPDDIPFSCPQNFIWLSECFAAVAFNYLPASRNDTTPINYTIRADAGLFHIDVVHHTSAFEKRILPLQWAIDQAIIYLRTGLQLPTPLEWPFTQETNQEQSISIRLSYIRGLRSLLVLALFVCYIGIAYQLPGAFAGERANLLTSHMKAMGLLDSARIISWHVSISLAYLPAWIIVSIIWHYRIFSATNVGLVIVLQLLLGLSLASWSLFVAVPFGKSPQLAAVVSTFLAMIFAILALVFRHASTGMAFAFSIVFPPGFYIFAIRAICGFENHQTETNMLRGDPDNAIILLPIIIAAFIDIFMWPCLAVLLERRLYDAREPSGGSWSRLGRSEKFTANSDPIIPSDTAISIRNLRKTFSNSLFRRGKSHCTAVSDLSLDIPKTGIFVLLGSNGAGKSTVLSILGNLVGRDAGIVTFEGGIPRPPRGTLGIVPQKNVLFPELTCFQTLQVWSAVKRLDNLENNEDIKQLLRDCDLEGKIHSNANNLSGGQKRKLQLGIGLVGGSKIVLIDECTSGVDPLSRRALWRTLTNVRHEKTILLTTHFLDEADLLADRIAVLAAPGKLVAEGSPVTLKSTLGQGYSVQVTFDATDISQEELVTPPAELIGRICTLAPYTYMAATSPHHVSYHLKTKDSVVVENVLRLLDAEKSRFHIASYDVLGTSIEDIFLDLMHQEEDSGETDNHALNPSALPDTLKLADGRPISSFNQMLTIAYKRALVARRSWLAPLLLVLVAVAGSCIPLFYLSGRQQTCDTTFLDFSSISLYLPSLRSSTHDFGPEASVVTSPPDVTQTLGQTTDLQTINVADNSTFIDTINQNYRNLSLGGISLDLPSGRSLVSWEASPPGINGPAMLNLATNILYNHALNSSGNAAGDPVIILASYNSFPAVDPATLFALKWVGLYGIGMAVFPAFFSLYVSRERRSSVQAMQMSNGLSNPLGLWLGHLIFDSIFSVFAATIIVIIFTMVSDQFRGLGFFWVILVLYGIVGALFAYCISLLMTSPLASFAVVAGYQVVMFLIYIAGYLFTITFAKSSDTGKITNIIHFTLSLLSPVASVLRAGLISVNLFSLLCDGTTPITTPYMRTITKFGGPILYLITYGFILLAILVFVDSGSIFARRLPTAGQQQMMSAFEEAQIPSRQDVAAETNRVSRSSDLLRVLHVTKSFGGNKVVDDVSLGVSRDTVFALLGPNGAGKTTCFNMIRGDVIPNTGDVLIKGVSVEHHPRTARLSLGVCPQFSAIDSQLTVRQHLTIYGRLKGLQGGELQDSVESLMQASSLMTFADRLANKLSGGNQRKLSLAIALIGNPSVILIDEFSTGLDAKMKRDIWRTLRHVSIGKAVIITTHSMEEASALANKVGILAKQMLAIGTIESLAARYATYEVHFSCRTREDVVKAQQLMTRIPGSKMADDVATRFEVPVDSVSLAQVFHLLSTQGDFPEYTVEKATLESVFLKVIRENNVLEEDSQHRRVRWWKLW